MPYQPEDAIQMLTQNWFKKENNKTKADGMYYLMARGRYLFSRKSSPSPTSTTFSEILGRGWTSYSLSLAKAGPPLPEVLPGKPRMGHAAVRGRRGTRHRPSRLSAPTCPRASSLSKASDTSDHIILRPVTGVRGCGQVDLRAGDPPSGHMEMVISLPRFFILKK